MGRLDGKRALITAAGQGIGRASALAMATESGGDVTFDFGADGMLIVENTSKAALANDIEIV